MDDLRNDPRLKDDGLRRIYAREWLRRPHEAFSCAIELFPLPEDCNLSAIAAGVWQIDPFVLDEKRRLAEGLLTGETSILPSKEKAALIAFEIAEEKSRGVNERLTALRLACDIAGYTGVKAAAPPVSPVNLFVNKVMKVVDKGNERDWTKAAVGQQRGLVAEARAEA